MNNDQPQGIFFDLDGTLINSAPMIINAIQELISTYNLSPISPETISDFAGMPPETLFQAFYPDQKDFLLHETIRLERKYRHLAPAYPGVDDLIDDLFQIGLPLAVITSQARQEMEQAQEAYTFSKRIGFWISCDDIRHPKPDPESILVALNHFQLDPGQVLFVGDTEFDIKAGRRAGVRTGGALWGGHNHQQMAGLAPDYTFHQPQEIISSLFK